MHAAGQSEESVCCPVWDQPVTLGQALCAQTGILRWMCTSSKAAVGAAASVVLAVRCACKQLADPAVGMCVQNELDSIRSELASLRQSIGKNRSADNGMSDSVRNGTRAEAMPGGNMV